MNNFISTITNFRFDTFIEAFLSGYIIDGRRGGYVIGNTHNNGGIHAFSLESFDDEFSIDKTRFCMIAEIEGGEFIINEHAYFAHKRTVDEINNFHETIPNIEKLKITEKLSVINTNTHPDNLLLWINSNSFIVNKYATFKYIDKLMEINYAPENISNFSYDIFSPK